MFGGHPLSLAVVGDPRLVAEDFHSSAARHHFGHGGRYISRLRDIAFAANRQAAQIVYVVDDFIEPFLVDVHEEQTRILASQSQSNRSTNPGGGAGHECPFALYLSHRINTS